MGSLPVPAGHHGFGNSLRAVYGVFETEPTSSKVQPAGDVMSVTRGPFHGHLVYANAVRCTRPALQEDWADRAFILMPLSGELVVHHFDQRAALSAGDMMLMDSRAPCRFDVPRETRSAVLAVPREMVSQLRPAPDQLFGRRLQGRQGIGNMLSAMLASIVRADTDEEMDPCDSLCALSVTMSLLDRLIEDGVGAGGPRCFRNRQAVERMRGWVIKHASDPDMSIETLCFRFGLSRRSLYRLFAELGTTPRQWLTDVRLDEARKWLTSADPRFRSVGQVAFAAGFNDSSHFARLFKRRFGKLPGALVRSH